MENDEKVYICTICNRAIGNAINPVGCGSGHDNSQLECDNWVHRKCISVKHTRELPDAWYCSPQCRQTDRSDGIFVEGESVWVGKTRSDVEEMDQVVQDVPEDNHRKRTRTDKGSDRKRRKIAESDTEYEPDSSNFSDMMEVDAAQIDDIEMSVAPTVIPAAPTSIGKGSFTFNDTYLDGSIGVFPRGKISIVYGHGMGTELQHYSAKLGDACIREDTQHYKETHNYIVPHVLEKVAVFVAGIDSVEPWKTSMRLRAVRKLDIVLNANDFIKKARDLQESTSCTVAVVGYGVFARKFVGEEEEAMAAALASLLQQNISVIDFVETELHFDLMRRLRQQELLGVVRCIAPDL